MQLKDEPELFDPRSRAYRFKLWVRVDTSAGVYYHVFWRRIAGVLLALGLAGWFGAAGGVWAFLRYRRGYVNASYVDLAFYPWRAEQFRTGLARHYLALGGEAIAKQNYREGYALLLAGLRRVPDDLAARRTVAVMQARFGLMHQALDTLADGVAYHPDLDYLKLLFGWLLAAKEDERALAVAKKILPGKPDTKIEHLFVALQMATVHFERGRYEETERIVSDWGLTKSLEGQILLAKCDAERGAPERALQRLEGEIRRFGKRDELYLELVRLHRAQGHRDEARRYAILRQFNNPHSPGARIDLLHAYHQAGDGAAESREVETFFADFRDDPRALDELAWFGAATHQPALLVRVLELARAQKFPLATITLAQIQEALQRGAYAEALALIDAAAIEKPSYPAELLDGMRAVAFFGTGERENGHRAMMTFADNARLRASDALLFARELRRLGATADARALLERACTLDPLNESALAELVRLEAGAGDRAALASNLPRYLKMRKPSRAVLEEVLARLDRPEDADLAEQVRDALTRNARNGEI